MLIVAEWILRLDRSLSALDRSEYLRRFDLYVSSLPTVDAVTPATKTTFDYSKLPYDLLKGILYFNQSHVSSKEASVICIGIENSQPNNSATAAAHTVSGSGGSGSSVPSGGATSSEAAKRVVITASAELRSAALPIMLVSSAIAKSHGVWIDVSGPDLPLFLENALLSIRWITSALIFDAPLSAPFVSSADEKLSLDPEMKRVWAVSASHSLSLIPDLESWFRRHAEAKSSVKKQSITDGSHAWTDHADIHSRYSELLRSEFQSVLNR